MAFNWFEREPDPRIRQLAYAFAYQYLPGWFYQISENSGDLKALEGETNVGLVRTHWKSLCTQCGVTPDPTVTEEFFVTTYLFSDKRIVAIVRFPEPPEVDLAKGVILGPYLAGLVWSESLAIREFYVIGQGMPFGDLSPTSTIRKVSADSSHGPVGSVQGKPTVDDLVNFIRSQPAASEGGRSAALLARAKSLLEQGNTSEGTQALDEAIQLCPGDPLPFKLRGILRHQILRDHAGAVADLDEVLRLRPHDPEALEWRGCAHGWIPGHEDQAIADFDEVIRIGATAVAFRGRGSMWGRKNDREKAIADLSESLRLDPNDVHTLKSRGLLWLGTSEPDRFERAIADFEEVRRIRPEDKDVHIIYLSAAWEYATSPVDTRRDGKRAVEYALRLWKVLGADWKEAMGYRVLAAAHAEAGDFGRAVDAETKAQELYSEEDQSKWGHLLDLYRSGRPYREASP
jgi:tetratricopeptide (TPR) repeat protein